MRSHDRERPGHYGEYTEDNRTYDGDDARTYYTEDNATYTEDAQTYMGDDVSQYTRGGGDATSRGWESRSFSGYYPGTYEEDEGRSGPSYVSMCPPCVLLLSCWLACDACSLGVCASRVLSLVCGAVFS